MSKLKPSYKFIPLTLNFFEEFAAKKAPPKAMASSAFIWVPIFYFWPLNISAIIDWSLGILDPPPISSIEWISAVLRPLSSKNLFKGEVSYLKTY